MHASLWLLSLLLAADVAEVSQAPPQVLDERLSIELFAAEPDVVTPCGIAVDGQGRVLVVESHTHFRPKNYEGPPADRIRLLADTDGDGRADQITTFSEGTRYTMNVAVHPDGSVYVATRSEIFRLRNTDSDGRADERTPIARLETKGNYPHNGLSGFAFDFDGNVYFGLGENLGADVQAHRHRRLRGERTAKAGRSTAARPTAARSNASPSAFGTRFTWRWTPSGGCSPWTTIPTRCRPAG